eukprot:COSAG01_NODE_38006_length_495_cov_8.295455_1_plen_111_part_10
MYTSTRDLNDPIHCRLSNFTNANQTRQIDTAAEQHNGSTGPSCVCVPRRAQTAEPRFYSVRFNLKDRRAAGVSGVAQHNTMGSGDAECVNPLNIDQQPNEHTSPPCPPPTE